MYDSLVDPTNEIPEGAMPSFLTEEQKSLADEIGEMLMARGQTVAVAEATTGGLISAALLRIAGRS